MAGRIRIPAHLQDTAKGIAAQSWTKRKDFPQKKWFIAIDLFSAQLQEFTGEEAENSQIIPLLAHMLREQDLLSQYVLEETTATVSSEDAWLQICEAVAWVILQKYRTAVTKGEWPDGS